jgi:hypothetical protein
MARRNECLGVVLGLLGVLGINFLVFILIIFLVFTGSNTFSSSDITALALIFGICLYQLLYVVPAIIVLKEEQRWGAMKGVIIGAVITALLSGPCFVIFVSTPS